MHEDVGVFAVFFYGVAEGAFELETVFYKDARGGGVPCVDVGFDTQAVGLGEEMIAEEGEVFADDTLAPEGLA